MELTRGVQRKLALKLQQSRLRLLDTKPFYGLLLLYMKFSLDINAETAYTDGERIAFDPEFLDSLNDSEVDFILMHEILHTALFHTNRGKGFDNQDAFNTAADIVVNSNILFSCGGNLEAISLSEFGESMHNLPDGREGYEFSVEELYPVILQLMGKNETISYEDLTSQHKQEGYTGSSPHNTDDKPGEPWDNHDKWKQKKEDGDFSDDREGDNSSAGSGEKRTKGYGSADEMKNLWLKRMVDATELINSMQINITHSGSDRGTMPAFMERIIKELRKSKLDWRTILQNFVQEDITDYSFSPPDRRFGDSPFFLPDFNEKEDSVKNILFMVDTSGSMSDDAILDAFSEIKGAIDQFDGKLAGWLGFFDAAVYKPVEFNDIGDLLKIRPYGGGGTDFGIIFEYVKTKMEEPPASIIILTDGCAPWPKEDASLGVPVLWLINNEEKTPPWGKIARIKNDTKEKNYQ